MSSPVALHHVLDGPPEGAPIVLSASLGTTHALWERQLPALAASYRVIRYDHRDTGQSSSAFKNRSGLMFASAER